MPLSEDRTRLGSDLEEAVDQFAHFRNNEDERREVANHFLQENVDYTQDQYVDMSGIDIDADEDLRNVDISERLDEEDFDEVADFDPKMAVNWDEFQAKEEELAGQAVEPDYDALNYDQLREAGARADIVSEHFVPVGRGDQAPKADLQRLVWAAAEEAAVEMLDDEIEEKALSRHAAETQEQIVIGGQDSVPNAKHLSLLHQYVVDGEDTEHYPVGETPDNSQTIASIDTDRAWGALLGNEGGYDFRGDVEDKAVDFHEQLGNEIGLTTEGDFNDVPMFETLLKAGAPPRYVNAPVGQGTVGEDKEGEQEFDETYTTKLMFSPELSREQGTMVYSAMFDGEVVTRTVDEIVDGEAHTTAAQNYDVALPVFSVGDRLWFNNPVRGADKYQGALDVQDSIHEVTDGEYDSHPFLDMGFPAVDLESGYPASGEMAEAMEETPHGDKFGPFDQNMLEEGKGEWGADEMLYHRNASLMAPTATPEFAEYFENEVLPEVYDEMGVDPENPEGMQVDEFMNLAYEKAAEAMATGEYTEA
jgi:hypothetical protein